MTKRELFAEILSLPVDERMELVEAIWDSISAVPEALPLTDWQKEELDSRLDELERDPDAGSTLEEGFARISRYNCREGSSFDCCLSHTYRVQANGMTPS